VLAVVFGPDGSTVMRRDDAGEEGWSALWNGDEAHDVQATGMLSAIVAPLAAAGVPVWVVSSVAALRCPLLAPGGLVALLDRRAVAHGADRGCAGVRGSVAGASRAGTRPPPPHAGQ
jgi:hypothetical protein